MERLRWLTPLVGTRQVIVVADRWDGTPSLLRACRDPGDRVLIRLKSHRTRSRTAVRCFPMGRSLNDGPLLQGTRSETQTDPSDTTVHADVHHARGSSCEPSPHPLSQ